MVDESLAKGKKLVLSVAGEASLSTPKEPAPKESFVESKGKDLYNYIGELSKSP